MSRTLRPLRDDALNGLAAVINAEYGPRCQRFEAGCISCVIWHLYDTLAHLTEGSTLDDPKEYERWVSDFTLPSVDEPIPVKKTRRKKKQKNRK